MRLDRHSDTHPPSLNPGVRPPFRAPDPNPGAHYSPLGPESRFRRRSPPGSHLYRTRLRSLSSAGPKMLRTIVTAAPAAAPFLRSPITALATASDVPVASRAAMEVRRGRGWLLYRPAHAASPTQSVGSTGRCVARPIKTLSGLDSAPHWPLGTKHGKIATQELMRPLRVLGSAHHPERWIQIQPSKMPISD